MEPLMLQVLAGYGLLTHLPHGENVSVLCPFHNDTNPSFSMNCRNGRWICFRCQKKGNIIDFVQLYELTYGPSQFNRFNEAEINEFQAMVVIETMKLLFADIEKFLADTAYLYPTKTAQQQRRSALDFFASLPVPNWYNISQHYMLQRGFTADTLTLFDVRRNPTSSHPIILPIYEQGKFKGTVSRRFTNDDPKYLNNEGFKKTLVLAGDIEDGVVMVVEGMFDLMKATQFGFENVCALLGWHASETQIKKLRKCAKKIVCALDNDSAGEDGYDHLKHELKGVPIVRFPFPCGCKDIGEISEPQFAAALMSLE